MPNSHTGKNVINTQYAKVGKVRWLQTPWSLTAMYQKGEMVLEHYQSDEFALLANVLASEGKQGKVKTDAVGASWLPSKLWPGCEGDLQQAHWREELRHMHARSPGCQVWR